jgi:hypothetical protein
MNPIWRRMKKRSPSGEQNGQLVHHWLLVHSARLLPPWDRLFLYSVPTCMGGRDSRVDQSPLATGPRVHGSPVLERADLIVCGLDTPFRLTSVP